MKKIFTMIISLVIVLTMMTGAMAAGQGNKAQNRKQNGECIRQSSGQQIQARNGNGGKGNLDRKRDGSCGNSQASGNGNGKRNNQRNNSGDCPRNGVNAK